MADYADTAAELRARASIVTDSYDVDPYNAEKTAMLMEDAADAIEELLARDVVPMDFHERCLQLEIKRRKLKNVE